MAPNLLQGVLVAIFATCVLSSNLVARQSCSSGYSLCSPPGATGIDTYDNSDGLIHLYINLVDTVNPQSPGAGAQPQATNQFGPAKRESPDTMCCASGLSCYLLQGAQVPMCYDKFTTDYALPNGDYGTISNGTLTSSTGVRFDLISGDYVLPNGQRGNIYSEATAQPPNTATLSIPTQYTSSGIGSAVPASVLGSSASYTTVLTTITAAPGTTSPSTQPSLSLSGPAVTPCSTCCADCGIPSTTINASMPSITSMHSSLPSIVTGTGNTTITPPITVGAGSNINTNYLALLLTVSIITRSFISVI